ncbi:MAG: hypothetical protein Q8J68_00565 [Methanolobus sp.]|uniref:hypothetical protein n=1 Tax=Methanolobus sp. TaxID=1874737 RepID=UPI002730D7FF|nr:hypothetical protein [Methanolobus sp.]MDP2215775.1 hypothetical protein [Methanolobus sp.]
MSQHKQYWDDTITIFLNFQTKCSRCADTHPAKVEITEEELVDLFKAWFSGLKGDLEIYRHEQILMVTTNQKVIRNYERLVGGDIQIASFID